METFQLDLVSPERKLASLKVSEVQIPGSDGDFTAMAHHAAFMATMRPGVLTLKANNDVTEYIVTGGFVEISEAGVSVLAEKAILKADMSSDMLSDMIALAQSNVETAQDKDSAEKRVADFKAIEI